MSNRWRFYEVYGHWLWAVLLVIAFVGTILGLLGAFSAGCGSGGPSQQAARSAMYVVRALCSDEMKVGECAELLEERAAYLDPHDGGVD